AAHDDLDRNPSVDTLWDIVVPSVKVDIRMDVLEADEVEDRLASPEIVHIDSLQSFEALIEGDMGFDGGGAEEESQFRYRFLERREFRALFFNEK
ncbi:MAG: hypothetical protein JZU67_00005, partial [Burkholderiaceae bacterium]|nr:hypothetical protein [Burkholderiaceae bacterium]